MPEQIYFDDRLAPRTASRRDVAEQVGCKRFSLAPTVRAQLSPNIVFLARRVVHNGQKCTILFRNDRVVRSECEFNLKNTGQSTLVIELNDRVVRSPACEKNDGGGKILIQGEGGRCGDDVFCYSSSNSIEKIMVGKFLDILADIFVRRNSPT